MNPAGAPTSCALCGVHAALKRSHIIPRFVSRALQVPDGPTRALLCGECEDLLGGYESTFARVVFHPLRANARLVAKYDKWLLQFATSVCWRVLENHLADHPSVKVSQLAPCRETWRQFIRGKRADVGAHTIHMLAAESDGIRKTVEMEMVANSDERFVYVRLGPIILLGLVTDPHREQWQSTRIHLEGKIKSLETHAMVRLPTVKNPRLQHLV